MDKMREEFEAWVLSEAERTGYAYIDKVLSKFGESYTTTWVDSAWQGWKASRAALFVELPPQWFSRSDDEEVMSAIGVIDALNCSGVCHE